MKKGNKYIDQMNLQYIPTKIILSFIFILISINQAFGTNISVWPFTLKFNYEAGSSNDATGIKSYWGDKITIPEFKYDSEINGKFAYITEQTNRKIKVSFDSNCTDMHLLINLTVSSGSGIGSICNYFVENYHKKDEILLTLQGSIPNTIGKRTFTWTWEIYAIPSNESFCSALSTINTYHTYYSLFEEPKVPMEIPWSSVLDYACTWANGQSLTSNIATEITENIYEVGFNYDSVSGGPRYCRPGYPEYFNLSLLVSDLSVNPNIEVNCLDMGRAVVTFCNALGLSLNLTRFNYMFPVNCIDPIGLPSPTNNPFIYPKIGEDCREGFFVFHAFAEDDSNHVWDATLKYDIDYNPDNVIYSNPNCGNTTSGYTWILPCNESESLYITRLVDDWVNWADCTVRTNCGSFSRNENIIIY
jgi:hypothetical protein